ncbi:RDD family protein [Corynebacterium sp. FDAARGOS 1242]|uniref:RDD family protein n=1 Tax=Corynebacterium sp. FDAARGOS 1242 TaxID=2778078 RepID=UPI00194E905E|nr:RDD family protein [Corynebacterium sp. FDAARGOS 1242]QRP97260.1 RDD family protein [Corynebacterium sp. FDAARGOS 1242]
MLPETPAPNLYTHFTLEPQATSNELGEQLAAADTNLEDIGYIPEDVERQEIAVAARILCEPSSRAIYDQGLGSGRQPTWRQLEEFAETGRWRTEAPSTDASSTQASSAESFSPESQPVSVDPSPAPFQDSQRATPGNRVLMAILDYIIAAVVVSAVVSFGLSDPNAHAALVMGASSLFTVAYYLVSEVYLGATPAKLIAGYTVRDVTTHKNLSWQQSIKRNWWRVASLIPLVGPAVTILGALYVVTTIGPKNALRGQHDIMANAEVVKK